MTISVTVIQAAVNAPPIDLLAPISASFGTAAQVKSTHNVQYGVNPFGKNANQRAYVQNTYSNKVAAKTSISHISSNDQSAKTLRQEQSIHPDGSYEYAYETDNGISVEERGQPKIIDGNPPAVAEQVTGSFSFVENGKTHHVSYVANENGFQPVVSSK